MLKLRGLKYEEDEEPTNEKSKLEEIDNNGEETKDEESDKVIATNNNEEEKENSNETENYNVDQIKKAKTSYIFIHPDRTTQEQEENRKLVTKLRERKKKGEKNIFIKNGKITTYQPFREDTQFNWV